jgi:hypothetical protein
MAVFMPRRTNVPAALLRWSVERAGIEFGLSSQILRKALAKNSAVPDRDGMFSTAQIIAALFGQLHFEKLRTQRARARKLELENSIVTASVLNRAELEKSFAAIADAFVSRLIAATEIPRNVREELLHDLATWPLALEGVAHRQTRLLPRNNGHDANTADGNNEENGSDYERPGTAPAHRRKPAARKERV